MRYFALYYWPCPASHWDLMPSSPPNPDRFSCRRSLANWGNLAARDPWYSEGKGKERQEMSKGECKPVRGGLKKEH